MKALTERFGAKALKRALILGVAGALLSSFFVAQAVTSTNLGSTTVKLADQGFSDDSAVVVFSNGIKLIPTTDGTPVRTTSPGVDVTSSLPEVTTAVTQGKYAYEFQVKESGINALSGGEKYRIEVYGTIGTSTSLLASFYMQQVTVEGLAEEGVTGTVDVGDVVHDS